MQKSGSALSNSVLELLDSPLFVLLQPPSAEEVYPTYGGVGENGCHMCLESVEVVDGRGRFSMLVLRI
jgi:hypothetical protein